MATESQKNLSQQNIIHTTPTCKACQTPLDAARSLGNKNDYALLSCSQCGTESYQGSVDYQSKKDAKIRRARKRIRRMIQNFPETRFLDVGCNYGFTVAAALELGLEAHGIDIDGAAITASKNMFGEKNYTTISVENYAAQDHKADMIYTSEVIEHVPDPDSFIKAIAQILDKGGILYLTTPDGGHFTLPKDFTKWAAVMPPEHIVYFTRRGIRHLLEKHGLRIRKFFFAFKPGIQLLAEKI